MQSDEELLPEVRPKRQTHRPARLQDYEVEYLGQRPPSPPQWRPLLSESPPRQPAVPSQYGPTNLSQFYSPPPSGGSYRDAAHYETPQLAQDHRRRRSLAMDSSPEAPAFPQWSSHRNPSYSDTQVIQGENAQLLQSRQALQSTLQELQDARREMKELINAARTLREDISRSACPTPSSDSYRPLGASAARSHPNLIPLQPQEEEREDWPPPPPWPEPEDDLPTITSGINPRHQDTLRTPLPHNPLHSAKSSPVFTSPLSQFSSHVPPTGIMSQPPQPLNHPAPSSTGFRPPVQPPVQPQAFRPPVATRATPSFTPSNHPVLPPESERVYRGPKPTIPKLTQPDPTEFARLRIALENLLPPDATELFKYQVLMDHLKLEEAKLIADAYLNSPTPYTDTMRALYDRFGQPHQLALKKIASVLEAPEIKRGDSAAFQRFSLQIQSLVGLLKTLGPEGEIELNCGSHVARLLTKLPAEQRADFRRHRFRQPGTLHTLHDLSEWLSYESWCLSFDCQVTTKPSRERQFPRPDLRTRSTVTVLHGLEEPSKSVPATKPSFGKKKPLGKAHCAYCESEDHYLSQCSEVAKLSQDQLKEWIQANKRCWRCARNHQAAQCTLKKPCHICQGKHLLALHEINVRPKKSNEEAARKEESCLTNSASDSLYLDRPEASNRVMLKVVPVLLHHEGRTINTFALLDDGSERSMLLPAAAKSLGIKGTPEDLPLRTVRQDIQVLHGRNISFHVSPATNPKVSYKIDGAFTASRLSLAQHTYPIEQLQKKHKHLRGLPIPALKDAKPSLLIGSDQSHLITPIEPVRLGSPGGPAAVHTRLGWTLQGPVRSMGRPVNSVQCLFTSLPPQMDELYRHVERLWQMDVIPHRPEKEVTRSKQDQQAVALLDTKTTRIEVDGVRRYATPLLRHAAMPPLQAPKESVMALLRSTERRLLKDPERAKIYQAEIQKLIEAGAVREVTPDKTPEECWYIPHHLVAHNGKNRLVFNCSHQYLGQTLNQYLLPGPTLGASLLGVLLRFRERPIAVSGDIKGMFHQVRLLPQDRSLLRFLWRDLKVDKPPRVFEWQVLPFGTTCSPCCATYALQCHVAAHCPPEDPLRFSVDRCFYVDNCLQSVSTPKEAKQLVDHLRDLLSSAGFELRQWACNEPSVLNHLPQEARSQSLDLWLAKDKTNPEESTLGLSWHWEKDTLSYKHRPVSYEALTLRSMYKVLASQYDPLGYLLPFSTRAKLIIRQLWDKQRGWDDANLPPALLQAWVNWEEELKFLPLINLPRTYTPTDLDLESATRDLHIFADASEQAYGAVAYLRTTTKEGQIHLAFVLARSRVAPKRVHSIPRLELCAALAAAQLADLLTKELTLEVAHTILWSDSTTVLTWLHSQSCRFKVFVGARVSEIQELTANCTWRYVDSAQNPADDLTRGKTLEELKDPNRWSQGPPFLLKGSDHWPMMPNVEPQEDHGELRKTAFCGATVTSPTTCSQEDTTHSSWQGLIDATVKELQGVSSPSTPPTAENYQHAETQILLRSQKQSFPEDYKALLAGKPVCSSSRLLTLAPVLDSTSGLIRVGGRLRRLEDVDVPLHPVVLDATHPVTRLLIQKYDSDLHHPGPERVFSELRRSFWIIRGREAVRKHQRACAECQRWRGQPSVPRMADLPEARLRLHKPAFYSTGVDCFGPMMVRVGRRQEKRWGLIFKCLTTRAVHLDLLRTMDSDGYLMALRRLIARRGTPAELWSDRGTNFRGAERELREAFDHMVPLLQQQLARQKIKFCFNPPAAPHFGGVWEREVRSVKSALYTCVGSQPIPEDVLLTVLLEVEAILNSKPLGYVSADIADIDPVTPNSLLMGRPDGSLPQVVYPETDILSRRRWRHSQVLADQFWSRFIRDYLPGLQARQKWQSPSPGLEDDAVVMLVEPQLPRAQWPIGRVVKSHQSDDGCIRSAVINIKGHLFTRPVARLVRLPALPSGEDLPPTSGLPKSD